MGQRKIDKVAYDMEKTLIKSNKITRGVMTNKSVNPILRAYYSTEQINLMHKKGVDKRMTFGINTYYNSLVLGLEYKDENGKLILPKMAPSHPLQALVVPVMSEVKDITGEKDPSNQQKYSPGSKKGKLIHKYDEIVLGYVAVACSAHCRYCYRLDLFDGSTGKGVVKPEEFRDYVIDYNKSLEKNNHKDPKTGKPRYPIYEVLLSGGDALILSNKNLYMYMSAAAEAGVKIVRLGSKELAFRPSRVDEHMIDMLKTFHKNYPEVHVHVVTHFTHPDEFLLRDTKGQYIKHHNGYEWIQVVKQAVNSLRSLHYVSLENQTPIILNINDDKDMIHLLHQELRRNNVKPKYIFQCRNIRGHSAFALPVEDAWSIHNEAMKGVADSSRSRFVMSTESGKIEVISMIKGSEASQYINKKSVGLKNKKLEQLVKDGIIVFKVHRSPHSATTQGELIIAHANPNAYWLTDYEDRIIFDGREEGINRFKGLLDLF
ncbi:MAG TPA: hypothetical protein QF353_01630 [Gammaproteobacteria bacterium]|nr:hypothetical protein [Gammaproteobacteria bacterium]